MRKIRFLATLCIFSALLSAVNPVWADENNSPTLSYFQPSESGFDWLFWNSENGTSRTFLHSTVKPSAVFWQAETKQVYYSVDQSMFRTSYRSSDEKPTLIAEIPKKFGAIRLLWLDRISGRLRILVMEAVADSSIKTRKGKAFYVSKLGARVPATNLPDWGTPYIASVLEWNSGRMNWRTLAQRATKDDEGLTLGAWVFHDLWSNAKGTSNNDLLRSYTCANGECRGVVSASLVASANKVSGLPLTADDLSLWSVEGSKASLLFGLAEGDISHDIVHMSPPVMLLSSDPKREALLPIGQRKQIGIGVSGFYLLVADEWDGSQPIVFDLRNGKSLLRAEAGLDAVWVPASDAH